jgi:signal transduction histidine kinase/HAMP domain-containing protein/ActR/RegA family two-component response regulator
MKTRTKMFAAPAVPFVLVLIQGWVVWRYAAQTPSAKPVLLGITVLTGLGILAAGGFLWNRIWRPVARLARTAREGSAGQPQTRLPLPSPDELRDLATAFNELLDAWQNANRSREEVEKTLQARTREWEQRRADLTGELRAREQSHRTLLAQLPGMAFHRRHDRAWTLEYVSAGCQDLLGVAPEHLTTTPAAFSERIHPEDRERIWSEVESALAHHTAFALEYRVRHANGQWRSVCEKGLALRDAGGQVTALEGSVTDLTWHAEAERQRRLMETQLRRAQRMETIGTLAGGVAHNFNNVLAGILGSAELIKMDLDPGHPAREFLDQIFMSGNRAREVVQQVLNFSQWRENERITIQLQPIVRECVKLLRATLPAMVNVAGHVESECPPVLADPTQIHQVIMSLCTRLWKALPEGGGHLRVELAGCEFSETVPVVHSGLTTGPGVRLTICNHNLRLSKTLPEAVFEPFATAEPGAEGADPGLGLAVIHGIVKAHEGIFTFKSEPDQGLDFHIYLPARVVEREPPMEAADFSKKQERILLVEDDETAGRTTEQMLHRFGYRVRWFQHPETALADFQARSEEYDLVVSDLAMPGMTGSHLAAALRRIRPRIPILITTGMMDPAMLERARASGLGRVLCKPVPAATLAREVAQRLKAEG